MFVDSDDYLECNMCEELLAAIRKENSDIAVCGFFIDEDDGSNKNRGPDKIEVLSGKTSVIRYFAGNGTNYLAVVWNKLYDKKVFDENHKIQFPVGMRYEDEFVSYKLLYHANRVVFITLPLYHYVQHAESFMHTLSIGDMMARKTCLMEYYRWAEEEAPDMKKLIEYAGIRIFNGFVWSYVQYGRPSELKAVVKELNVFILGQTKDFWKNPYVNIRQLKNFLLMKAGLLTASKVIGRCFKRK